MKRVNKEEDRCRLFIMDREEDYPRVLYKYKKASEFFPGLQFEKATGGVGTTNIFRFFLTEYIKDFTPEKLIKGKPYELTLNKEGQFVVINKNTGKKEECLSESEKTAYHYLCFLYVAKFWQEFELMRDLHYIPKPLIIQNFANRIDESVNTEELLEKAKLLNRKIVLFDGEYTEQ